MQTKTLSKNALDVMEQYLHLPFAKQHISCPYFNNKRSGIRGGLRALIGKGSPEEIAEEAKILAMKEHVLLNTLANDALKQFLVNHTIGIDCSGFVYHVLAAE